MKKELRPVHDALNCDVCGRTILKGERTETYLAPGGHRNRVCQLCFARAEHHGWIRETADGSIPARFPREEKGPSLLSRLRRRRSEPPAAPVQDYPEADPGFAANGDEAEPAADDPFATPSRPRSRPKDPRHVRAVPTTAGAKVERALELFNDSDHQRTIAGLRRTLGDPLVSARPDDGGPSAVSLVVAWELSWYRYRVDLGDESDPVLMLEKGEEIDQIDEYLREWNAALDPNGRVLAANSVSDGGSEG